MIAATDMTPFLSFVGAVALGICTFVGFVVLGRGAWAAAAVVWGRRSVVDRAAESDILERIERDSWMQK